jgi:hypothetical protein
MIASLALAVAVFAQPIGQLGESDCKVDDAALERDIDLALSKGQMLRRRQLVEALSALQARCETVAPEQDRAARVEKLEQESHGSDGRCTSFFLLVSLRWLAIPSRSWGCFSVVPRLHASV